MTYNERRLARFIRLKEHRWCPGYQYSEYAVYQMCCRSTHWAFLDLNFAARDFGRALIKELLK